MSSDINQILNPQLLSDFREEMPPVQCILWKGGNSYETITFEEELYPFDTLDQVKRLLCHHMRGDAKYLSKFLFIGVPIGDVSNEVTLETTYYPLDYLWYPIGSNQARDAYQLRHPVKSLSDPDTRFIAPDGSYASPNYESRSRTTLEHAFLKHRNGSMPTLHVFPFHLLYDAYRGVKPISEMEWNKKFAPYFPDIPTSGPFTPKTRDIQLGIQIKAYVEQRENTVYRVNRILQTAPALLIPQLTGILQMVLLWKKPVQGFQGCAALFYPLRATLTRPYLRLLPADGTGITKLHVEGILPIPTLHDPRIITQWNKEVSPTPKIDFCTIKYVHRPAIMSTPPLYGTLQVMNDGTMKLAIQPPKTISKLLPDLDFRHIDTILETVFEGLPQQVSDFQIHELSAIFTIKTSLSQPRFTKKRLQKRIATFQPFFREIKPLPEQSPILSLRYKAINQYTIENEVFAFITLWSTRVALEEGDAMPENLIEAVQNEFQLSEKEAADSFTQWFKMKGQFVVDNPEEGDISEGYHSGVDIHIYAQHPSYVIHIHRMDNEETYRRIFTLLSILFVDDDRYFEGVRDVIDMDAQEDEWDQERREKEAKKESEVGAYDADEKEPIQASLEEEWGVLNDPLAPPSSSSVPFAPPTPAAPAALPVGKKPVPKDGERRVQPHQWFIRKLQELDNRLFGFTTATKGDNGYTSKCQSVDDRQPVILTKDQYDNMRTQYENDDDLFWYVYPLEGTEDPSPPAKAEKVTIMKYGSDVMNINYLFCPRYYCLYDDIMVRERDFIADRDRNGNPKPDNTCPFCYGGLLTRDDRKKPMIEGRTVVERKKKAGSVHDKIGFLKDTTHPDGLSLPCCFIKQTTLRMEDPRFEHIRSYLQEADVLDQIGPNKNEAGTEAEIADQEVMEYYETKLVEYNVLFQTLYGKYILESNKFPSAGHFAIPSRRFDEYFHQDSSRQLATRTGIHLHIRPTAHGFLRVGIDNTVYESLLGVIAPLLNCSSIIEVKERIEAILQPRIFLNAHFGNLVMEFFDPTSISFMPETSHDLMKWSEVNLGIAMTSANSYALLRIFNSYYRFIYFVKDPRQRKELRHIQPLLAEPGLFTTNGLQLIVLDDKGEEEHIEVRCPIFGVSAERHTNNDMAFISRMMRKIGATEKEYAHYELYIHTTNKSGRGSKQEAHHVIKAWKQAEQESWPEIVKQRMKEYITQCQSSYRAIYTPQRGIVQESILPLSVVVQSSASRPDGIVKDQYNHLVAVTFRARPGASGMVTVPVVDDGVISVSASFSIKKIYLDWEDIRLAPVEDVIRYFQSHIRTQFSLYTGYEVKYIVRNQHTQQVVAIQLNNNLYVPVGPPQRQEILDEYKLETILVEQFESDLNKQMSGTSRRGYNSAKDEPPWNEWTSSAEQEKGCGKDESMDHQLSVRELEELYQQFRVMLSRWLTSQRSGAGMRRQIEDVLFRSDLPDYERRKRLDILLSSTLLSWFYPDENWSMPTLSMLRKDCRVIPTEDGCTGSCRWKETNKGGKCLLHVPQVISLSERGDRSVDTTDLFTKRILDELVRFPARRKQIMTKGGISSVTRLTQAVREEDQYIIPEASVSWIDLLRFDWLHTAPEQPKYYEEMSREFTLEDQKGVAHMPDEWITLFGEDTPLVIEWSDQPSTPFVPLMPRLGMSIQDWGIDANTIKLTHDDLKEFARRTKRSVGLLDLTEEKYVDDNLYTIFIKRKTEQEHVTLFIMIPGRIGLLMEGEQAYLPIELLPEEIQRRWKETPITLFITKPQKVVAAPIIQHTTAVPATQQMLEDIKKKEAPLLKKYFQVKRPVVARPPVPAPAPVEPEQAPLLKKTFPVKRPVVARPSVPAPVEAVEPEEPEEPVEPVEPGQAPLLKKTFPVKRPVVARPPVPAPVEAVEPVEPEQAPLLKKTFPVKRPVVARPPAPVPVEAVEAPLLKKYFPVKRPVVARPPPPPPPEPIKKIFRVPRT